MIAGEEERQHQYDLVTDDFSAFLAEHFVPAKDGELRYSYHDLRNTFVAEFPKSYNKGLSMQAFNKKLKGSKLVEFKHIETGRGTIEGFTGRGWYGLKLKDGHSFPVGSDECILISGEKGVDEF